MGTKSQIRGCEGLLRDIFIMGGAKVFSVQKPKAHPPLPLGIKRAYMHGALGWNTHWALAWCIEEYSGRWKVFIFVFILLSHLATVQSATPLIRHWVLTPSLDVTWQSENDCRDNQTSTTRNHLTPTPRSRLAPRRIKIIFSPWDTSCLCKNKPWTFHLSLTTSPMSRFRID